MNKRENYMRAIRRDNPEWVPIEYEAIATVYPPVIERPDEEGLDAFGVRWLINEDIRCGTYPAPGGHVISDISRWSEELILPDVDVLDWDSVGTKARAINRESSVVSGFIEMGLFERSYLLLGMEDALIAYLEHTNAMEALIGAIADYKIRLIERLYTAAKPDMIWFGDDWGTQNDLFLPPDIWRKTIGRHTKRIYDRIHDLDMIVNQHSCGKIERIFGDLCEMGADMWNPCQPCNDLITLKRRYGHRISFAGGLDSQFVLDNKACGPEAVRAEVRRLFFPMSEGGGYLIGPSHGVPYEKAKLDAMHDEINICNAEYKRKAE